MQAQLSIAFCGKSMPSRPAQGGADPRIGVRGDDSPAEWERWMPVENLQLIWRVINPGEFLSREQRVGIRRIGIATGVSVGIAIVDGMGRCDGRRNYQDPSEEERVMISKESVVREESFMRKEPRMGTKGKSGDAGQTPCASRRGSLVRQQHPPTRPPVPWRPTASGTLETPRWPARSPDSRIASLAT